MRKIKKTALAAAMLFGMSTPVYAATIINGSFEQGTNPGSYTTLGAGSTAITGWTVGNTLGGIDYIGTYWQAANGVRSVDLAGNGRGSIYQDVATTIGQTYRLNFSLAGNPDGGSAAKVAVASIGGGDTEVFTFFNIPGVTTRSNMGWQAYSYDFTATQAVSRVTFASANGNSPYGAALDVVSISAVPEPAAWAMMLAGFGMIGFGARRRSAVKTTARFA